MLASGDPGRLLGDAQALTVTSALFILNRLGPRGPALARRLSVVDGARLLPVELMVEDLAFAAGVRVVRARVVGDPSSLQAGRSYTFRLDGPGAVTLFASRCLERRGSQVCLALPDRMRLVGFRRARRVKLTGRPAPVTFHHRGQPDTPVRGVLGDVALEGLSFALADPDPGLAPGAPLDDLRIELREGRVRARGVVRSVVARPPGWLASCGVELIGFRGATDAERWRRFVFARMHPNLVDGRARAAATWRLLEGSHYIERWTPLGARPRARAAYLRAWRGVASQAGHVLLVRRGTTAAGMVAASVIYPGSWLLHHLARDAGDAAGDAQTPLRQAGELISGILHRAAGAGALEHFVIYLERDKRWNQRLYVDFARGYPARDKLALADLEVFRRSTAAPVTRRPPERITIARATPALRTRLARTLAATTGALERRALALDEDRLALGAFSRGCARHGHERRRALFFALEHGRPAAALLAESGGEGVNLFGLLNTCRVVALDGQALAPGVRAALLDRAVRHYRRRGKGHFLLLEDPGAPVEALAALGFEHVSGGLRWIAHRDVIPAWTAYLDGLLASAPEAPPPSPEEREPACQTRSLASTIPPASDSTAASATTGR